MTISWFSVNISSQDGSTPYFSGFFSVDNTVNVITSFYDSTNPTVDILYTNIFFSNDNKFIQLSYNFSFGGTSISSFPYLSDGIYYTLSFDVSSIGEVITSYDVNGRSTNQTLCSFIFTPIPDPF
jgi:hypothetical protein